MSWWGRGRHHLGRDDGGHRDLIHPATGLNLQARRIAGDQFPQRIGRAIPALDQVAHHDASAQRHPGEHICSHIVDSVTFPRES